MSSTTLKNVHIHTIDHLSAQGGTTWHYLGLVCVCGFSGAAWLDPNRPKTLPWSTGTNGVGYCELACLAASCYIPRTDATDGHTHGRKNKLILYSFPLALYTYSRTSIYLNVSRFYLSTYCPVYSYATGPLSLFTKAFSVCVSDNPCNFLVQQRFFDEGSDWKLSKVFLADWLSSCLTQVCTIKANIQCVLLLLTLCPLFLLGSFPWVLWETDDLCTWVWVSVCVLSVVRRCFKAGMWVSGVSKSSWSSWLQSFSLCLSVSFFLSACHHCHCFYTLFLSHHLFSSLSMAFVRLLLFISSIIPLLISLPSTFHYLVTTLLSSICRSQQTWDIGVQTVTRGHRLRLPWLLPLLLWPWRQSKIHLTSSLCFIPLSLVYLLMPSCTLASLIYKGNTCSIFAQIHHCQVSGGDAVK